MPPFADGENGAYDDGKEDDGEGETPEESAVILHCIFWDFCHPPPCHLGGRCSCSARGGNTLAGDAMARSNDNDDNNDDNDEEEDKEELERQ
jgi:hypothetical protein